MNKLILIIVVVSWSNKTNAEYSNFYGRQTSLLDTSVDRNYNFIDYKPTIYYDDYYQYNYASYLWKKNNLTWTLTNFPSNIITDAQSNVIQEIKQAFRCWEYNSDFEFYYLNNDTNADIVITFVSQNHHIFVGDNDFMDGTLGHAYFPEDGNIHLNDNIIWSLSFDFKENTINLFYTILHEIGHSLGLSHVSDYNSIMFPSY